MLAMEKRVRHRLSPAYFLQAFPSWQPIKLTRNRKLVGISTGIGHKGIGKEPFMTLETIKNARRLVSRGRMLMLGAAVALACPACASKDKVASGPGVGLGAGMAPPPLTAAYDPSKQMGASSGNSPWGSPGGAMPSGMPTASANGSSFNR
jgi:hypothetical protein